MMISARNATGTNVQDFLVNDELLLPILKAFVQCIQTPYVVFKIADVFSLVYQQNSLQLVPKSIF